MDIAYHGAANYYLEHLHLYKEKRGLNQNGPGQLSRARIVMKASNY